MKETQSITVGGAPGPRESVLLDESIDEVCCGWCGAADSVVEVGRIGSPNG